MCMPVDVFVVAGDEAAGTAAGTAEQARAARLGHARELYSHYAASYDDHLRKKLLYTGPRQVRMRLCAQVVHCKQTGNTYCNHSIKVVAVQKAPLHWP